MRLAFKISLAISNGYVCVHSVLTAPFVTTRDVKIDFLHNRYSVCDNRFIIDSRFRFVVNEDLHYVLYCFMIIRD